MKKLRIWLRGELDDFTALLRAVPASVVSLFVVSVVMMNILASKEVAIPVSWMAFDCGFSLSWMSFLTMDIITKHFGGKASVKLSLFACAVNLVVCGICYLVSLVPGNWSAFYEFSQGDVANKALNMTFEGTWYVLLGSTIAFIISSIVNSVSNILISKYLHKDNFIAFAIRSWASTAIGQFVDNMTFALIVSHVFFGWSLIQCFTCAVTAGLFELVCEMVFSPIGYKVCARWKKDDVGKEYIDKVR